MIRSIILCILLSVICSCTVKLKVKGIKGAIPEGGLVNLTTPIIYIGEGVDDLLYLFVQDQIKGSEEEFLDGDIISGENVISWIVDYINSNSGVEGGEVNSDSGVAVQGLGSDLNPRCLDVKIQCSRLEDKNNYICSYGLENPNLCQHAENSF